MTLDDIPDVMELERDAFQTPWTVQSFTDELNRDVSHVLLARDEPGTLIGFVCFWALMDEAHILNIAVRKGARRKGIGRTLALEALKAAYGLGARAATLEVREKNVAAVRLYSTLGFVKAGLRRGYYENPNDNAVIMWLHDIGPALQKSP
jgi:ribosomal-protein-alanine N-acetyltransferase